MVGDLKRIREMQLMPFAQQDEEFDIAAVQHHTALGCTAAGGKSSRLYTTTVLQGNGQC